MSLVSRRIVVAIAFVVGTVSATASAQQLPPPDQARRMLEARPGLVAQLRRYYVHAAGGPMRKADVEHSCVTQPDGSVESIRTRRFLPDDVPTPRPGSVVFVTQGADDKGPDPIARLSVIAQIIGSLVAIVAITR